MTLLKFTFNRYKTGISIILFLNLLLSGGLSVAEERKTFKILVVHSYNQDYVAYHDLNEMIASGFKKEGIKANIRTVYLDCERRPEPEEIKWMYELIENFSSWKPDLILVNDDQATYSLVCSAHPELQTIPVVFTGVNYPNWEVLKKHPQITGFWDKPDYLENVKMIEQLMGKMRINFLFDDTFLGKQATREIADQFKDAHPEISQRLYHRLASPRSDSISLIPLLEQRRDASYAKHPDSTLFYFVNLRDQNRNEALWEINGMSKYSVFVQIKYDYTTMRIGHMAGVPAFSVLSEGFDYNQGILGGYITTLDIQAAEGTAYAARILRGEKVTEIPIVQSAKRHVVDWNEIKRWDIPANLIPSDYEIIHMPLHIRYQFAIIIGGLLFSGFILSLISYLSYLYSREARRKREAQLNLQKEKEFLSLALEGSNIFAWKYNFDKNCFTLDKDFFESQNIPPRSFTSEQIWDVVHPDEREQAIAQFNKTKEGGPAKATVNCRCDFNGKGYLWYEFRYMNIATSHSIIGLILNIQEYKNRELELTEARDLAAKAELKQSFLANMSHEIRTPLNAIVGFSNILVSNDEQTKEERQEFITIINRNCELLLKLVGDILEISRIESNNLNLTFQPVNLNEFVENVYASHQMMIPENVTFLKEMSPHPVRISTDRLRLQQVVSNFISNAAKFTSSGSIAVGYRVDEIAHRLFIYVQDTGRGIPVNEQKMIFERFYKRDEFAQGTGLGLSICEGIINKLGGEISLESEEGKGSTFTIALPYNPEQNTVIELSSENVPEKTATPNMKEDQRKNVLIAEDNESNYMLLKTILQKDYNLTWVTNGRDAVKKVGEQPFDLVLMDIKMPEMNGIEALREIRKTHKDLPVIMQTAYAFESDKEAAVMEKCSGFLTKPIVASKLLSELRNIFQQ